MPPSRQKCRPSLTAKQRRGELIAILSMAAARVPLAIAIPPESATKELSKSDETGLDVSVEMPLSVTTG